MAWATIGAVLDVHPSADPELAARALYKPSKCPNLAHTDTMKLLGADLKGCSWEEGLICASLAVGCPTGCAAAMIETG